jgi:hypothetical protein
MAHFLTNRGKLLLMQGGWNSAGGTAYKMGLLAGAAMPAAIDTATEVSVLNTVADLLPTLATECTGGTYARLSMTRTNATEDDANNRVNMDASDVVFASGTNGQQTYGAFWYDATSDSTDTTRLLMGVLSFASAITFNGSTVTVAITDLVRAS